MRPTRTCGIGLLAVAAIAGASCASTQPRVVPDTGILTVGVSRPSRAAGAALAVVIDGEPPQSLPASGLVTSRGVAPGAHTVRLTGVPPACRVEGEHPRRVTVTPGRTAAVRFAILCG